MKTSAIATAFSAFAALAGANPVTSRDVFQVGITFNGADGSSFSQNFPADTSLVKITNPLSVTSISSSGGGFCTFTGVDGTKTVVVGEETVSVGPPQAQTYGSCDIL